VLYQRPEIAEVAVIGTPDAKWGEAVTAVVALKKDQWLEPEVLIAWARERLAGFKCPRSVKFVDALPRTATGKVLKRELRQRLAGENATAVQR
jgi:acyl-CoA synthetase (AMP-forming)/AMP-acid ligase II